MGKQVVVAGLLIMSLSMSASAVGFMGPPTAGLGRGQMNVGFSYMYSEMDLDTAKLVETDYVDGALDAVDPPGLMKIRDFTVQRYYGVFGYGFCDWCDAYVQVGAADVKAERWYVDEPRWIGLNFDNDFAWGWGTRVTFHKQDSIDWGASVQMNWLDTSWNGIYRTDVAYQETDIDSYDLLVAVGPTIDLGCCKLYGGPFYYYFDGEYELSEGGIRNNGGGDVAWLDVGEGDLEAESFGGFIGTQFTVWEDLGMTVELSFTGDGWAGGVATGWTF